MGTILSSFVSVLAIIIAIVATVFLCLKVLPAKYDGKFSNKALQHIHDYFNFKNLYLESVMKVLFTFLSIASVVTSLLAATLGNMIRVIKMITYEFSFFDIVGNFVITLIGGVLAAVIIPLVLRLVYEGIIMFILLVKNVISINNKLK